MRTSHPPSNRSNPIVSLGRPRGLALGLLVALLVGFGLGIGADRSAQAAGVEPAPDVPEVEVQPAPDLGPDFVPDSAVINHHRYPYPRYPRYPYPIVSGCATPVAPPPPGGLPVPPGTTPRPSATPLPSPTPGGAAGGAMATTYRVCPQVEEEIPDHVKQHALAQPWAIYGFGKLRNPNTPYHPLWNSYRRNLSLQRFNLPYSECNPAIWKAGCP